MSELSARLPEPKKTGSWLFVPENLTIGFYNHGSQIASYEVDIESCNSSAAILDWIAQLAEKRNYSDAEIGQLVRTMNTVLRFQWHFCGWGCDHNESGKRNYGKSVVLKNTKHDIWKTAIKTVTK